MSDQVTPSTPASTTTGTKAARKRTPCAICGREASAPRAFGMVRPAIAQSMLADHPDLHADSIICGKHAAPYRSQYVAELLERERGELSELEKQVLESLAREETARRRSREHRAGYEDVPRFGERAADVVADFGGSWNFIGCSALCWSSGWRSTFSFSPAAFSDPYPFILSTLCCHVSPRSRRRSS